MPDRSKPPLIREIGSLRLPVPALYTLDNGLPVYAISMGTQEALKLELVFFAGRPYEHQKMVSRATLGMLKEGTGRLSSAEIAEQLDFYGSSINFPFNLDTSNIVLYSLRKHLAQVLPVLAEIVSAPVFPEAELQNYIKRNRRRLQVDLQKTDIVAYRQITEHLYGADHPYGYNSFPEMYATLRREDLIRHFQRYFNSDNCFAVVSGYVDEEIIELLNRHLGQVLPKGRPGRPRLEGQGEPPGKEWVDHPDSVQAAIRIGRRLFSRDHPDFAGMYVLNTILGGYFGSRLMSNVREDKGYTYNIYSMLDTMAHDGVLFIGTEVGNAFVPDTLAQIYEEVDELRNAPVDPEELEMVRNYLLGTFLTMLDGPFNISELIVSLLSEGLPVSFFEQWIQQVRAVSPDDLQALAVKYLDPSEMWEVVVGKKS